MRSPKVNVVRLKWCQFYSLLWVVLLIDFVFVIIAPLKSIGEYLARVLWCSSWGAIGIALGLYNSRKDRSGNTSSDKHYFFYFSFVWFLATLAAFVMLGSNIERSFVNAYASAMLIGIVVGFAGDKLAGKIFDLKI
jgi:hypothetical protein